MHVCLFKVMSSQEENFRRVPRTKIQAMYACMHVCMCACVCVFCTYVCSHFKVLDQKKALALLKEAMKDLRPQQVVAAPPLVW